MQTAQTNTKNMPGEWVKVPSLYNASRCFRGQRPGTIFIQNFLVMTSKKDNCTQQLWETVLELDSNLDPEQDYEHLLDLVEMAIAHNDGQKDGIYFANMIFLIRKYHKFSLTINKLLQQRSLNLN